MSEDYWRPGTQEEADATPILLTPQQYVGQLRINSDEWFDTGESDKFCLVNNSIKWTLIYISPDNNSVTLQRGQEKRVVSAQDFVNQFSFDHWA